MFTITVNFGSGEAKGYPPESATVAGAIEVWQSVYRVRPAASRESR